MLIKKPSDIRPSEITDEKLYRERRRFLRLAGAGIAAAAGMALSPSLLAGSGKMPISGPRLGPFTGKSLGGDEPLTDWEDATTYNNFYEFGTGKEDPARYAGSLRTDPWTVTVEGEVARPGNYALEDLLGRHPLEERIYRLRCVEGWSMVIPWVGFSLGDFLRRLEPTSRAKYVEFTTLHDPEQMPGQKRSVLPWPYVEGLRMDEAKHPLTVLAVGMYGRVLPNQNGAPLRLIVPWKYGFKSIKSIVKIRLAERQPMTTWNRLAPGEYGFYANVNPEVDHPRWSQRRERRIGEFFRRKTEPFNGYAEQVAHLYQGLDLRKHF